MRLFGKDLPQLGGLLFALVFALFCIAFYLPLSSKATNNIFYAGLALPALLWMFCRPAVLMQLIKPFAWVFVLLTLLVVLDASDAAGLKKALYLSLFFVSCLLLNSLHCNVSKVVTLFALVSLGVFLAVIVDWLWIWNQSAVWVRYDRFLGEVVNPVYFSMLISFALIFLWVFHISDWLEQRSRWQWLFGLFVLSVVVLLCSSIFQSRSTLLGYAIFFAGYLLYKRMLLVGLALLLLLVGLTFLLGFDQLLLQRGFSYRLDIWQAAWVRLNSECGLWLGCGADGHLLLGSFHHAHSGYVSMLYRNGLLGALLFALFAGVFLWKSARARSRWLLLALLGWGSLLTTSNGVLTTPQPLWVYFWLPTFMAILDAQRGAVAGYLQARSQLRSVA